MGSSGSGNFGDYKGGGGDRCGEPLDIQLEEVARSAYFIRATSVPPKGLAVHLSPTLIDRRLAVLDSDTGIVVGLVPTEFNFLAVCIANGYTYAGAVTAARVRPAASVEVHLDPARA